MKTNGSGTGMALEQPNNVKEYYRLVTEVDIGLVARELLAGRQGGIMDGPYY